LIDDFCHIEHKAELIVWHTGTAVSEGLAYCHFSPLHTGVLRRDPFSLDNPILFFGKPFVIFLSVAQAWELTWLGKLYKTARRDD